jgi:hypothetical protein
MYVYLRTARLVRSGPGAGRSKLPIEFMSRPVLLYYADEVASSESPARPAASGMEARGLQAASIAVARRCREEVRPRLSDQQDGGPPPAGGCAVAVTDDDTCSELAICNRDRCVCASMMDGWVAR